MSYTLLKATHVSCVAMSYALFVLRGLWTLRDSPVMQQRWIRIVPHTVDTLLLASALVLAFLSQQYPFAQPWLTAKFFALLVYIALGSVALKRARDRHTRLFSWLAAQAVFGYIVLVAIFRTPTPFID